MRSLLDPSSAAEGVADITKRSSKLSHVLFDIASGLVVDRDSDSTIPQAISNVAREFAEIAQLSMQLSKLLGKEKVCKESNDAGVIFGRLDLLLREFEETLDLFKKTKRAPQGVPKWFKAFFTSQSIVEPINKCQAIKELLRLFLSILRIADTRNANRKTSSKSKKKRKHEVALMLARECEFAESWVEANRQVIKALMNEQRRLDKSPRRDLAQHTHWTETPGATAGWIYGLIFTKILSAQSEEHRLRARGGRVTTVRTTDGNEPASDSEQDVGMDNIAPDLERELDVSRVRHDVVNELLERWAGLDSREIRQISSSGNNDESRLENSASGIIKWYLKSEKSASDDASPPPTHQHSRGRSAKRDQEPSDTQNTTKWSAEVDPGDLPRVPTPPSSPEASAYQHARDVRKNSVPNKDTERSEQLKGIVNLPQTATEFVLVRDDRPSATVEETQHARSSTSHYGTRAARSMEQEHTTKSERDALYDGKQHSSLDSSRQVAEVMSELELDLERRKEQAAKADASRTVSSDTIVPTRTDGPSSEPIILPRGKFQVMIRPEENYPEQHSSLRRPTTPKPNIRDSSSRRLQSNRKVTGRHNPSRVEFDTPPPRQKNEMDQNLGAISESKSRERRTSTRDSSSQKKDTAQHKGVMPDEMTSHGPTRHVLPQPRYSDLTLYPEQPNWHGNVTMDSYGLGRQFPAPLQPHMTNPSLSGVVGPYITPAMLAHGNGYVSNYYEQSVALNDSKKAELMQLQKRVDDLDKGEKARRDAEEATKEEGRMRAQEDELRSTAHREKVEKLKNTILRLQESARRDAEQWQDEKQSLEKSLKLRTVLDEQINSRTENAEIQPAYRKEEVERLYEIIERFQQSDSDKTQEWAAEKERIIQRADEQIEQIREEYEEQLEQTREEYEEQQQKALEKYRQHYEEYFKEEQKKTQAANARAEVLSKKYNEEFTRRYTNPPTTPGNIKASQAVPNVLDYLEKRNSSLGSTGSHETETEVDVFADELHSNKWDDQAQYRQPLPKPRAKRHTVPSIPAQASDESSNVILFPPRAGWNDLGYNQIGNHLSLSGFKAMFEEREEGAGGRLERIGSAGNVLRGTLFWQPPASTAEADLYKSLRNSGWRPTYVRTTASGQTWFFGAQPVHAQFFSDMYRPQVGAFRTSHISPNSEKEYLIIGKDLVEIEELEFLGHVYKEAEGRIFLDPTLTSEDIDHIVARSFLAREGRYRKKFRNTQLRASQSKVDIVELASEAGDSFSEMPFGSKERGVSLWSLWSPWSR